jgi:hypothetical protein
MKMIPLLALVAYLLFRAVRTPGSAASRAGEVLAVFVGITPAVWAMAARGVSSKLVVGYGVLFFGASVLVKWAVYYGVLSKHIYPNMSPGAKAIIQGLLSSACEMGAAAIAFNLVLRNLGLWQVFGFGAGAAGCEALIVSLLQNPHAGGEFGEHTAAQIAALESGPWWLAAALPFVDRGVATTAHIACRGLVASGVASGRVWPIAMAVLAFAVSDGFVMYGLARKWEFAHPVVAARLFSVPALAAAGSAVAWHLTSWAS